MLNRIEVTTPEAGVFFITVNLFGKNGAEEFSFSLSTMCRIPAGRHSFEVLGRCSGMGTIYVREGTELFIHFIPASLINDYEETRQCQRTCRFFCQGKDFSQMV